MATLSSNLEDITNQLNAGPQGQHGHKKERFNFNAYYERKAGIQFNIEKNAQKRNTNSKKWQFKNCCLIALSNNSLKPNLIFSIIKEKLISLDICEDRIAQISQLASSKNWQIQFKDDQSFNLALGKTIDIGEEIGLTLIDANDREVAVKNFVQKPVTLSVFLRIHWLPYEFKDKVVEFLKTNANFLKVIDVSVGKWKEGKSPINNGILNVKVNYDVKDQQKFLDLIGIQKIDNQNALFQISGAPPKCLYCKQFGHMRKNCNKLKTTCTKCNKSGHSTNECSMANRMISNNNDADLDDENIEVDENQASNDSSPSTNTNKNTSNTYVEIIDTITATTSAAQTVIPNPNQSVEVKQEKENITKIINEVANPKFVIPLLPRSASADSKSKQG